MITAEHPLMQLLALIDQVWMEADPLKLKRGAPKYYSEKTMFKIYVVSLLKKLWARRSVWRYLSEIRLVAQACGLARIPDRPPLDRRLGAIGPQPGGEINVRGPAGSTEPAREHTFAAGDR